MRHGIPVVHRLVGLELHHHRLGARWSRHAKDLEVRDRLLQVHQHLAGLVIGRVQGLAVLTDDTRQPPPSKGFMKSG